MISSTYKDFFQVRADLTAFLQKELGFEVLISEASDFPVEPDTDTLDNCRRRVEQDADILVLIIGGRYGFVEEGSDKSITHVEYLIARNRGLPIFVFVKEDLIALGGVYRNSPEADFDGFVEDVKVFDFVEAVRSRDRKWCFEFKLAQEIVEALRTQLAYMTYRGLDGLRSLSEVPQIVRLNLLHGEALRFAIEKPDGWEYKVLAAAVTSEISKRAELKRRHELGLAVGPIHHVPRDGHEEWLDQRTFELLSLIEALHVTLGPSWSEAQGEPGQPGDPELIAFTARALGEVYESALDWAQRWRLTNCHEVFDRLKVLMPQLVDDILLKIEQVGPRLIEKIGEAEEAYKRTGEHQTFILNITLESPSIQEEIDAEIARVKSQL